MKKQLAMVFGITKDLDFALANVLISMKKNGNMPDMDIYIYHDGLSKEKEEIINRISPCNFIKYHNNISDDTFDSSYLKLYSNMCLARFECFDMLKKYKKVIWNDVDILIQNDISGLMEYGNKTGLAMTYSDINFLVEANFNGLIDEYNMCLPLLNSGIIVFSDKLENYDKMTSWCYDQIKKYNKRLRYLDQGVLNLLVQEFNIKVEPIDISKYCCHPMRSNSQKAAIVHSYGYDKFWNSNLLQEKFPLWVECNKYWEEMLKDYREKNLKKNAVPEISVIMSVYERYTYLKEAIESILNQTYQNFELIIVVEKSEKQEEINEFINKIKDQRIVIINNDEKLGFAQSLNVGIKKARGKYIARMDDDDISLPSRLEKQYNFLESNPDISILGTAVKQFMNRNDIFYPESDSEKIRTYTLINNQMFHPTIMLRKEIINKYNLYYDSNYKTEDAELWSRAVKYVKMSNLKEVLLYYRICDENETQVAAVEVLDSDIRIIGKQLEENLNLQLSKKELYLICGRVSNYGPIYNKELLRQKKEIAKKIYNVNKKIGYYNPKYLAEVLELENNQNYFKRILKKILKPIYKKLMYRVEILVDNKIKEYK